VPTFIVALFASSKRTDCHPWNLAIGALIGTIITFILFFGYSKDNTEAVPLNPGIIGGFAHVIISLCLEVGRRRYVAKKEKVDEDGENEAQSDAFKEPSEMQVEWPDLPVWDVPKTKRFGEGPLTPQMMWKFMEGINEPLTNSWYSLLFFLVLTFVTPFVPEDVPPLTNGVFAYAPAVVRGLPWWALKIIVLSIIPYLLIVGLLFKMPSSFPTDEAKIQQDGVNPEMVELTMGEMNRRTSYDERNVAAYKRRSTIRTSMVELGLAPAPQTKDEFVPDEKHRRLSALVKGEIPDTLDD